MRINKIVFILSLIGLTCIASALPKQIKPNQISLLFLQQAQSATLTPQGNDCYNLALKKTSAIVYFSNEPVRETGAVAIEHYLKLWQEDKITPNAAIHGLNKAGDQIVNIVATLANPVYNRKERTMTYQACFLNHDAKKVRQVRQLAPVTLFIDSFNPNVGW